MRIKPLKLVQQHSFDAYDLQRGVMEKYNVIGGALMQVYRLTDNSWRIWFQFGGSTSEMDDKIRNIPTREEAFKRAQEWWEEWIKMQVEE